MGEYINSKQVRTDRSYVSCGVMEAHHLPGEHPGHTLFGICNALYHKANGRPAAFVVFSDTVDKAEGRGERLATFIRTLVPKGDLFESTKQINPRTGHAIRVWVLTLNHEFFRKWYTDEFVNRVSENT